MTKAKALVESDNYAGGYSILHLNNGTTTKLYFYFLIK